MKLYQTIVDSILWLHTGSTQKLHCNEVWNSQLGFDDWATSRVLFCFSLLFVMLPFYFWTKLTKGALISPLTLVTNFWQTSTRSNYNMCDRFVFFPFLTNIRLWSVEQRLISPQWRKGEQRAQTLIFRSILVFFSSNAQNFKPNLGIDVGTCNCDGDKHGCTYIFSGPITTSEDT